ncbi:MmgE/PrpD family protein [Qaidamihabitans albus]|uniref:MmgE/PrpD family protein n=1 Tax=Qaidamihabitans albus TaxID=2795733 RepID=UPI0018F251B4|nr:MmgE/PrpD family protein [Qaidamihabitans albus]
MTSKTLEELAEFACRPKYQDLPERVVHETRRTLLDSLGCALAALSVDKGKRIVSLARRLGGASESTVVGMGTRVAPTSAALAMGELINALDYDALYQPGGHISPNVIPAPLAVAETVDGTGQDLITALAVAHEIGIRISKGMSPLLQTVKDDDGYRYRWTPAYGGSRYNLGAGAGVGHLLDLDPDRMAHAISLAGHHAQVPTHAKFSHSLPTADTKYGTAGWQSTGAVVAGFLAESGYLGDLTLFDGDTGLWRFTGSETWNPERVTDRLGKDWLLQEQQYKPYPCCRLVHTSLDLFYDLLDEHGLRAADVDSVKTFGNPYGEQPHLQNRDIRTPVDAQFSIAYIFAVAAHRVKVGVEWQEPDVMRDPDILSFMDKVSYEVHPKYLEGPLDDPRKNHGRIEVTARGRTYTAEAEYAWGTDHPGFEFSDDALVAKFRHNAVRVLPEDKVDSAINRVMKEDDFKVRDLMADLSL